MSAHQIHVNQLQDLQGLQNRGAVAGDGFREVLDGVEKQLAFSDLKFSSHAQARMESRGIELSGSEESRLMRGFSALKNKGIRDGLVVVDDKRFVVSVANRTVITVMESAHSDVYTNIQGVAFE